MQAAQTYVPDQLIMPDVIANPYPAYEQLREQSPLRYMFLPGGILPEFNETLYSWALLKYDDVYAALRDHDTFSSTGNPLEGKVAPKVVLITDDPPRHTRFRRLVNKAFTLRRIETLEPMIARVANELLDTMGTGQADVVDSYTIPLPVRVIAHLLGIPGEDYQQLKRWSDMLLAQNFDPTAIEEQRKSNQDMVEYFGRIAATRRSDAADDLISALVEAEVEGESLEEWEIMGFCVLLLVAGNETTTNLMGNMLNLLAERPDLWQQLRQDRSLVEPMIEETLRYESPVQRLFRFPTRDVEVSGVTIPKGEMVSIFYGAANRDPAGFAEPDEFRLDRDLRNHVAFGMGIHYCLGAPLARAEAKITLNAYLDRFSSIGRGDAETMRQFTSPIVFGFRQLPLALNV